MTSRISSYAPCFDTTPQLVRFAWGWGVCHHQLLLSWQSLPEAESSKAKQKARIVMEDWQLIAMICWNSDELHRINLLLDFANDTPGFALLPIESSLNISFQTIAIIFAMMQYLAPASLRLGGWLRCTWWAFAAAPGAKTALCHVHYVTVCPDQPRSSAQAKMVELTFNVFVCICTVSVSFSYLCPKSSNGPSQTFWYIKILFTSGI